MRRLGSLPDPFDPRDRSAETFLRAVHTAALPREASNRNLILNILDQGRLGSCVANAVMQAIRAAHVRQGIKNPELGSRLMAYYFSRAIHHDQFNDSGTYTRTMFQALNQFGFCRERYWPYDDDNADKSDGPAKFKRMPGSAAIRAAFDQKSPTVYSRISSTGYDRIDAIKRAVAAGFIVCFGTDVSNNFCNDVGTASVIGPPNNLSIAGGHELCVYSYDANDNFGIVNSWSTDWGMDGCCVFNADYLADPRTRDIWIVESAPNYSDVQ